MTQILVPIVFALLVFLFFGAVLHLTKYKKRNSQDDSHECCSGASCHQSQQENEHDCTCAPERQHEGKT